MAQKTIVTVECDLDGEEGAETVSFSFEGAVYEIDVCATHAKDLREKFAPYTEAGRRTKAAPAPRRHRRPDTMEIREWAKQRGHQVSERGRIPAAITAEYEASR